MKNQVVIIGGQAGAKIAYEFFYLQGKQVIGFMSNFVKTNDWAGIPHQLFGEYSQKENLSLLRKQTTDYFVATGDNFMRRDITKDLTKLVGKPPINAIHPQVVLSKFTTVGFGNLICPGAIINVGTKIGNGTIINTGAVIEHDVTIHDFAQISPNATLAGYVTIKETAFISSGATLIPHVTVGQQSTVAAGATVLTDVEDFVLVAGCPAKVKKRLDQK